MHSHPRSAAKPSANGARPHPGGVTLGGRSNGLRSPAPEELLDRAVIEVDLDGCRGSIEGKRILVTGGGGSIGSELGCRLAPLRPERLVLLDRAENTLYLGAVELQRHHPEVAVVPVVGDILDVDRLAEVMARHAPDLVFHAAAYKHVPLMEEHPLEAIANNVFGTEAVARASVDAGASRVVFISTDKAVNPVAVMGMTKRVAETLLSIRVSSTSFVTVRFGNVLGSDGSVLPLFERQIRDGGPVTVTDRDAARYFMLISEAAQLVIRAGVLGAGGEIFSFDMGEQLPIMALAARLIRLSGLTPGTDIAVEEIGLRPGERLREQTMADQSWSPSGLHDDIYVSHDQHLEPDQFAADLEELRYLVKMRDASGARDHLRAMTGARVGRALDPLGGA